MMSLPFPTFHGDPFAFILHIRRQSSHGSVDPKPSVVSLAPAVGHTRNTPIHRGGHRGLSAPQHMDESPFGEAPEETEAVIAALQEERNDDFPRAVRALGNRNFRLFWTGNFLSNIGSWMQNVAQGWLVLTLTNSSFWLGVVGFAGSIPFLIFTL